MDVTLVGGIDPGTPGAGGTRNYVLGLASRLASKGVAVSLIARRGSYDPPPGLRYIPIPSGPSGIEFLLGLTARAVRLRISPASIIHAQRPDLLVPFLVRSRNPKVCTLHGVPSRGVRRLRGRTYGYFFDRLERTALRGTDRLVAVDEETATWYRSHFPSVSDRVRTVPVAVDTALFHPRSRESARERFAVTSDHVVVFAGRLTAEKRVHLAIEAIRGVPGAELLIAGDGPEDRHLKEIARGAPVRFLGTVPYQEMPFLLSAADVLVLPSEYEGLPTVVLEAWACGVPVVATRVGALPRLVKPGRTGWFVDDDTHLANLLAQDLPLAAGLRAECIAAAQEFSWNRVIEKILSIYREATAA